MKLRRRERSAGYSRRCCLTAAQSEEHLALRSSTMRYCPSHGRRPLWEHFSEIEKDRVAFAQVKIGKTISRKSRKVKQADRPDSVTANGKNPLAMTAIPLGRELLHGSSFLPARSASNINACLFGIAPGGGYRVSPFVTQGAAFALPSPKDSSLWPYSAPRDGRPLAVTLLYGVRTFLPPSCDGQRLSGLLHTSF
jgi:hypothetical protein